MSHVSATELPAATMRLYREPRYPTGRATENLSSSNISISGTMKLNPTEVRSSFPPLVFHRHSSVRGCHVSGHGGISAYTFGFALSFPLTTLLITAQSFRRGLTITVTTPQQWDFPNLRTG